MKSKQKVFAVSDHKINGQYRVTFGGNMSQDEARAEADRLNAAPAPVEYTEISSGLGIGGVGSDDYNIHSEYVRPVRQVGDGQHFGKHGLRYDEACEVCHKITTVCNDCGCCSEHCSC